MRKSEVDTYWVRFEGTSLPSVNVKVHRFEPTAQQWADLAGEFDPAHVDYAREHWDELTDGEDGWEWFNIACGLGWEALQFDADMIWEGTEHAPNVQAEGRSGGHAVVYGLPPIESWDAIALGRWARFVKCAESIRDDVPRSMAWLIIANVVEPMSERENAYAAAGIL